MVNTVNIGFTKLFTVAFYNLVVCAANRKVCEENRIGGQYRSQIAHRCEKTSFNEFEGAEQIEQKAVTGQFEGFIRLLNARFAGPVQLRARVC